MKKKMIPLICAGLMLACSSSSTQESGPPQNPDNNLPPNSGSPIWSIPQSEVLDGGPGKDGIPALLNPGFRTIQNTDYLKDDDLVIGIKAGNEIRAYPHVILDWHEIVNDDIEDVSVAVTYCPLTGTGIGWDRIVKGKKTSFGVSGLLYNTNLIPYDRETNSNWSQILNECVNGPLIGEKSNLVPLVEMDWKTWKLMFPNSKVLSINTGYIRTYGYSPYGNYNTNNDLFLFPVPKDHRLPLKERVHAIINGGQAKAYRFKSLATKPIIRDTFNGTNYLVVGNQNFIVSFQLDNNTENLVFEYNFDGFQTIMKDHEGNQWNVFGQAISGPRAGQALKPAPYFMGFWFSIPAFYNTEIYEN